MYVVCKWPITQCLLNIFRVLLTYYFENALKNSYAPIFGAFLFWRSFFKDYLLHFWITLYFNHCFSYVLCDYNIQALLWLCCTIQSVAVLFYISIMMWLFLCWFCCASFTLLIWHCNSNDAWGMVWYSMIWYDMIW